MSDTPIIAAKTPANVELTQGDTYHWCRCGRSSDQPFCDGSHAGTGITPLAFKAETTEAAYLCRCKSTGNQPYCDGTHARLGDVAVGSPAPRIDRDQAPVAKATPEEPTVARIHALARRGLDTHHGEMTAMGVPRKDLPHWDDIQILTAQLATKPLADNDDVDTEVVIGPRADKPLRPDYPLCMSTSRHWL